MASNILSGLLAGILSPGKPFRVGGVTIYVKNGRVVFRQRKNGKSRKKRTAAQKKTNKKFSHERKLYKRVNTELREHPTWKRSAVLYGASSGNNLFYKVNHAYLQDGKVVCYEEIHFSLGSLSLPRDFKATRGEHGIALTWDNISEIPNACGTDRLLVMVVYEKFNDRPTLVEPDATRADGFASVPLDPAYGAGVHIYPFFEQEDKMAYSNDHHFGFGQELAVTARENDSLIAELIRRGKEIFNFRF